MLNAAWPKMYWQLWDWYLMPTGAFYGAKKACEPRQLIYNYGDRSIYLVDDSERKNKSGEKVCTAHPTSRKAEIRLYDIESSLVLAAYMPLDVESGTPRRVCRLPRLDCLSMTYFLSLRLLGPSEVELANNFYWLSTKPDVLDYHAKVAPWEYYTPSKEYADLTMLDHLPPAQVSAEYGFEATERKVRVELTNRSDKIAFFIELLLTEPGSGEPLVPVFWQDNYVSLLPHETRVLFATFPTAKGKPSLSIRGWNTVVA
jgi:exo-1,4-beta-D-glucosaminidase